MRNIKYVVYREGKYYVSQCLNVDISSFGESIDEAVENLKEALELYYDDEQPEKSYINIDQIMIGETVLNYVEFLSQKHHKQTFVKDKQGLTFNWEGGLVELKDKMTSVELQHKALDWR